ncbi:MAG: hypothetical protein IT484_00930 [Gammaproteobacteria bacterium]|nr:hypothetical protein [Gammaproteobacteria bacterium]
MHQLDMEQLAAAADRIELPPEPVDPAAAPPAAPQDEGESWAVITPAIAGLMADALVPAWAVTDEQRAAFAGALAPVLDRLFPGGIGAERWAVYLRLLMVGAGIVAAHKGQPTGCRLFSAAPPAAPPPMRQDDGDHTPA